MNLPQIHGLIERRLLVNFRAGPAVVAKLLPEQFKPQLFEGHAVVGICLIRLAGMRPAIWPSALGLRSENAAHRFAVEWDSPEGKKSGVYVHRRDTSSILNQMAGGRIFPGVQHAAEFEVRDDADDFFVAFKSRDNATEARVHGAISREWPTHSLFKTLKEFSDFFKAGSVGYSPGFKRGEYQRMQLVTKDWLAEPFKMREIHSSLFMDVRYFPPGSVEFDHALIMRNLEHHWTPVS